MTATAIESRPTIVRVRPLTGEPKLEELEVFVAYGEKQETSGFGEGKYWYRHDLVSLKDGTVIGRIQTTNKPHRQTISSIEGSNYCVVGYDPKWIAQEWREKNGGATARKNRITPGLTYQVRQTFGLLRTETEKGIAIFNTGERLHVVGKTDTKVKFMWINPISRENIARGAGDSMDLSAFELLVETFSLTEIR